MWPPRAENSREACSSRPLLRRRRSGNGLPDEAWDAGLACVDWASGEKDGPWPYAVEAINAAAPHIDRAARIDELKRLMEQAEGYERWGFIEQAVDVDHIKARLVELEADA